MPGSIVPVTLDEVADALVERLLESMPAGGVYGRTALVRLPGPVEHLLTAALERRVARETAPPATDWIDADDPDVREAARRWREATRDAARYPPDAWPAALADAARQSLRHLVEPAEAAAAFCFAGESGPLPIATVRARLSAFGPYPYLREIAERYAERKGLEQMDRAGLTTLLRRIDRRMTSSFGAGEWDALLAPLYALMGVLPGLDGTLPAEVLRRFFSARGADAIAKAVAARPAWGPAELHEAVAELAGKGETGVRGESGGRGESGESGERAERAERAERMEGVEGREGTEGEAGVPGAGAVSEDTSLETVFGVMWPSGSAAGESAAGVDEAAPVVEAGSGDSDTRSGSDDSTVELGRPAPADEALWQAFAAGRGPAGDDADESDVPDAEPLWQRLARTHSDPPAPVGAPTASGPAPEALGRLESRVLGPDALAQRDWFVAHVAGGSEAAYRRLLEGLDAAQTWTEAWPVLAAAFRTHRVDIYSDAAVALTDAAESRFGEGGRR